MGHTLWAQCQAGSPGLVTPPSSQEPFSGDTHLTDEKAGSQGKALSEGPALPRETRTPPLGNATGEAGKPKAAFAIEATISGHVPRKVPGAGAWQSDGEEKNAGRIWFLSQSHRAGAQTTCLLCLSRDVQVTAPGRPGEGEDRVWGCPGGPPAHRRLREALAAGTCSVRPHRALRCPPGPEWPGTAGRKGGCRPGGGQRAGHRPASPHGRGPGSVAQGVTNQVS